MQLKSFNIMHTATIHSLKFKNIHELHTRDRKRKLIKKVESTLKKSLLMILVIAKKLASLLVLKD